MKTLSITLCTYHLFSANLPINLEIKTQKKNDGAKEKHRMKKPKTCCPKLLPAIRAALLGAAVASPSYITPHDYAFVYLFLYCLYIHFVPPTKMFPKNRFHLSYSTPYPIPKSDLGKQ